MIAPDFFVRPSKPRLIRKTVCQFEMSGENFRSLIEIFETLEEFIKSLEVKT